MVWQEGKFGVHSGRTVRAPSCRWDSGTDLGKGNPNSQAGYVSKVVNQVDNLTDERIQRKIDAFPFPDGFENKSVIKESHSRFFERFATFNKGREADNVILSLNKRQRWLLPDLLKKELQETQENDEKDKPRVVLIERRGTRETCENKRVKKGDCVNVVDNFGIQKKGKRSKFSHVGDLYKGGGDAEIIYEVSSSVPGHSWPNYREFETDLWSDWYGTYGTKSKYKTKGFRNKKRCWGLYSGCDVKRQEFDCDYFADYDGDADIYDDDDVKETKDNMQSDFDIGSLIASIALKKTKMNNFMDYVSYAKECSPYGKNKESRRIQGCPWPIHQKGTAVLVDQELLNGVEKEVAPSTPHIVAVPPATTPKKPAIYKFHIRVDKLSTQSDQLREEFRDSYREGKSTPRKFSITPNQYANVHLLFQEINDGTSLAVTAVSDEEMDLESAFAGLKGKSGLNVSEVVKCIQADNTPQTPQVKRWNTAVSYDVLSDVCSYEQKALQLEMAYAEIKEEDGTKEEESEDISGHAKTEIGVVCRVCYEMATSSIEGFSVLNACSHWFCDECWQAYLDEQIRQGKTSIVCPGYKCATPVDNTTILALVPELYLKYTSQVRQKAVEANPSWRWCPGNKCSLVNKVTKRSCYHGNTFLDYGGVPVACACGKTWCSECQEETHWPAKCEIAQRFRKQTKAYQEILNGMDNRIKSVFVKRCPACRYPVEKNGGCPHMSCTMCGGHFCWECLKDWNLHGYGVLCKGAKKEEEVELTDNIGSARYNRNVRVATNHHLARNVNDMCKAYKTVERIAKAVESYKYLQQNGFAFANKPISSPERYLQKFIDYNPCNLLRKIVDYKFLLHTVIEGCAMVMAMSKTNTSHHKLQRSIDILNFVISRLDSYQDIMSDMLGSAKVVNNVEFLLGTSQKSLIKISKAAQQTQ
ncbi:uncharacterized protein LOC116603706 [Nematostella vectensis]|uniref:uncharacterized protein LOC116603706 n=1 Tax=Nematostella vectensis TaxID=45351 RepID=UPI002076FD3C|nr:uncharacterized protein LOC116603706 [Nematostella vectensis]